MLKDFSGDDFFQDIFILLWLENNSQISKQIQEVQIHSTCPCQVQIPVKNINDELVAFIYNKINVHVDEPGVDTKEIQLVQGNTEKLATIGSNQILHKIPIDIVSV